MLVDKPAGPTSHDVVQRVRRAYGTRAAGHTGTLDPFATGLLIVLLGRATRLARFVEARTKTYLATARLGVATDTDDLTGTPLPAVGTPRVVPAGEIEAAFAELRSRQQQTPPAFSAKHVGGTRSYELARRGTAVELAPVPVDVTTLELVGLDGDLVTFRTVVSAGTYVRGLARDLGLMLGTGAHLTALRREAIGTVPVDAAVALDALGPGAPPLPPEAVLPHLPPIELDAAAAEAIGHGRAVPAPAGAAGEVTLMHDGRLIAIGIAEGGMVRPVVVLEPA